MTMEVNVSNWERTDQPPFGWRLSISLRVRDEKCGGGGSHFRIVLTSQTSVWDKRAQPCLAALRPRAASGQRCFLLYCPSERGVRYSRWK